MNLDRATIFRVMRFGLVGVSGIGVNQGGLMLLHGVFGLPLLPSSLVAIEASILTNFYLNTRWTWKADLGGSLRTWLEKAIQYHAVAVLAAVAGNVVVLMSLVSLFGVDYRIANLVGIAVGGALNYFAAEIWIYRNTPRRSP